MSFESAINCAAGQAGFEPARLNADGNAAPLTLFGASLPGRSGHFIPWVRSLLQT